MKNARAKKKPQKTEDDGVAFDLKMAPTTLEALLKEQRLRTARKAQAKAGGLIEFVRYFWSVLEPETKLVEGWLLDSIA